MENTRKDVVGKMQKEVIRKEKQGKHQGKITEQKKNRLEETTERIIKKKPISQKRSLCVFLTNLASHSHSRCSIPKALNWTNDHYEHLQKNVWTKE